MARWHRSGRYYGQWKRKDWKRGYKRGKGYGQMKVAKEQADQSTFTINIPSEVSCFNKLSGTKWIGADGLTGSEIPLSVYVMNIFDQLNKSEFYANYANMYDEFKIERVKVKLLPTSFTVNAGGDQATYDYKNYTVYTAWDRSGLSQEQVTLQTDADIRHTGDSSKWIIRTSGGTETGEGETVHQAYGGLYTMIGNDITTYSSAESKVINPNTNTSITRWISPKTMQEKSQWIPTGALRKWYKEYDPNTGRYYGIELNFKLHIL